MLTRKWRLLALHETLRWPRRRRGRPSSRFFHLGRLLASRRDGIDRRPWPEMCRCSLPATSIAHPFTITRGRSSRSRQKPSPTIGGRAPWRTHRHRTAATGFTARGRLAGIIPFTLARRSRTRSTSRRRAWDEGYRRARPRRAVPSPRRRVDGLQRSRYERAVALGLHCSGDPHGHGMPLFMLA